ncbi:MAG: hypothetical protein M3P44_05620 [Actinomycetota bacterium]|nr:hypothetical protein [Actinomycetota bacterium]
MRTWLPVGIIAAGVVAAILSGFSETGLEGGGLLISAGLSVWLLNLLYRVGVTGDRDRTEEDDARAYYDRHGRWPDEEPPPPPDRDPHRRPDHIGSEHGRRRRR